MAGDSMSTARPRAEIVELQYLRAIAVLMVVVGHLHQAGGRFTGADILGPVGYLGFAGVDVFFVISGFIIHTLYRSAKRPTASYALKRLNRIYPLYWIFTALALLGYLAMGDSLTRQITDIDWLTTVALLPSSQPPLLLVGWTLIHEIYFYLVYGLLLFLPGRWRWAAIATWLGLTLLAQTSWLAPTNPWSALVLSPFNLLFIAGLGLAELRPHLARTRWIALPILLVGVAIATRWTATYGLDGLADAGDRVFAFLTLAIALVWAVLAWQPRWHAALTGIGDWSYAIYLGHLLVIGTLARIIGRMAEPGLASTLALYMIGLALSLALGFLTHRFLEMPLLAAGKKQIAKLKRDE